MAHDEIKAQIRGVLARIRGQRAERRYIIYIPPAESANGRGGCWINLEPELKEFVPSLKPSYFDLKELEMFFSKCNAYPGVRRIYRMRSGDSEVCITYDPALNKVYNPHHD